MTEEIKNTIILDLTAQAHRDVLHRKLEKRMFQLLKEITDADSKIDKARGGLIVIGEFVCYDYKIPGMRQIGTNPLAGVNLNLNDRGIKEDFEKLLDQDGAVIIDTTGQIMAAQVYLQVDRVDAQVEEGCSTRHISASSFSMNPHIVACFTMSEETGKVRVYQEGQQKCVYDPRKPTEVESEL